MISPELCRTLRIDHTGENYYRYFGINGHWLRVASSDREILDRLGSFFYPYIETHEHYAADRFYELTAIVDAGLFDDLKANLPPSPDDLLTTTLRHDLEYNLRCFFSKSGEITIIEDEQLKLFYVILSGGRTKIVGTAESRMRTGLLRVIRGAWINNHDAFVVHSSVVEKHGRGVVIAGDKHAGKSTSLLQLCTQNQYGLVANDRCLLGFDKSSGLRALGVPTVVNLRPETIKPFPDLQYLKTTAILGVYDLARALAVEVKSEVEVAALVFLFYDADLDEPSYRRLAHEETREMLSRHLFSQREYEWVNLLKIGSSRSKKSDLNSLPPGVPAFQLISNERQLEERARLIDSWSHETG